MIFVGLGFTLNSTISGEMFLQKGGLLGSLQLGVFGWQVDLGLYEEALIEASGLGDKGFVGVEHGRTPDFLGKLGGRRPEFGFVSHAQPM